MAAIKGGGVYNFDGLTIIRHSTITDNEAGGQGGGVSSYGDNRTRTEVYSSIISGNTASDVDFVVSQMNSFQSLGYNLIGTGNAATNPTNAFDQTGDLEIGTANPLLGLLADNGGPTMTHALLPGSPAIDEGDPGAFAGVGNVPLYDQRGEPFNRVYGERIDIGAFERQPMPAAFIGDYNQDGSLDAADYVVWRKMLGTTRVPPYSEADGSGDGMVGPEDHGVWTAHFGETLPPGTGSGGSVEGGVGKERINYGLRISACGLRGVESRASRVESQSKL